MSSPPSRVRPSTGRRRFGYVVAILVNALLLFLMLVSPGWEAVPILTGDTERVIPWIGASFGVGILANLVFLARDPIWLKAVGDLVTTIVGLLATWQVWQVFPFDFSGTVDAGALVRVLLVIALAGGVIGAAAAVGAIVKDRRTAPRD
jgi:hypothetical protein